MFKNYFKVAFRSLAKQKYFTSINIIGLALGIASAALIFLWISHETSYDKYHDDYQDIYRIVTDASIAGQEFNISLVPSPLAKTYSDACPEVELTARTSIYFEQVFRYKENNFKEEKVIAADSTLFDIFHYEFIEGNPDQPFKNTQSAVLTESVAKRYFGNESALGKTLQLDPNNIVTVSAVIKDIPSNTHNQFDVALFFNSPDNWGNFNWTTYVKFRDGFSLNKVNESLTKIVDNDIVPTMSGFFGTTAEEFLSAGNYIHLILQPVQDIHLHTGYYGEMEPPGNKTYVTFFIIIGLFILIIAGINYMNLSTAYYDTRVTEVGIRKANGATPWLLIKQFLFESIIISTAAFILGFMLIQILLPFFTKFLGIRINENLSESGYFMAILYLVVILIGLISGLYPAAFLSRFNTTSMLRNKLQSAKHRIFNLRSALVIVQFTITIIVIVATLLVRKQVDFMLHKELGYDQEYLVVVEGARNLGDYQKQQLFREMLTEDPAVSNVCFADTYPGENYKIITGYALQNRPQAMQFVIKTIVADYNYFETFGMEILQGRGFRSTDRNVVILNENAANLFEIQDNPLNHHLVFNDEPLPVIGVVKNFHHDALNISLDPMVVMLDSENSLIDMIIRISGGNPKETIARIEDKWNQQTNNVPFEYYFLDEQLRAAYSTEIKAGKIFSIFSFLSIIIACMGILGITSFLLQRRVKEIGVRKVNGATLLEILALLNKDYVIWVAISFLIATPMAWYAMYKWLESFAFRTEISWWIFLIAGFLSLTIALITVSWLSYRAATKNPVEALRYE